MRRILYLLLAFTIPVVAIFLIWRDRWVSGFSLDQNITWLRHHGDWAGIIGIGLLAADLLLPIPSTLVMTALGTIHGFWIGSLLNLTGTIAAGTIGYGVGLLLPQNIARRWISERAWTDSQHLFNRTGPWAVAASRALPIFPEAISCLAGLMRLRPSIYFTSLTLGSAPMALIFAFLGQTSRSSPASALTASIILPPLLWLLTHRLFHPKT